MSRGKRTSAQLALGWSRSVGRRSHVGFRHLASGFCSQSCGKHRCKCRRSCRHDRLRHSSDLRASLAHKLAPQTCNRGQARGGFLVFYRARFRRRWRRNSRWRLWNWVALQAHFGCTTTAQVQSAKHQSQFLKNIDFGFDYANGKPIFLEARAAVTAERLRIFIDYSGRELLGASTWQPRIRVAIGELKDIVKEQYIGLQLASQAEQRGPVSDLYWGKSKESYPIFEGPNRIRLVALGQDGQEQHYYFMLVLRDDRDGGRRLTMIKEVELSWVNEWESDK
jgi:hypothetical protein